MTKKELSLTITQSKGIGSSGDQVQTILAGEHYHTEVYKKLVSIHNSNVSFDPQSLKDIIIDIDHGFKEYNFDPVDFEGIDINLKNEINNHSKDYFEQFVEMDFYPQFYKIDAFLGLKVNQLELQPKVDRVIKNLNRQIITFQNNESFEAVLLKICTKLIDENHSSLQGKDDEILLILYYFYCNCCIGKKTKEENNVTS